MTDSPPRRPNILFIFADQWRGDWTPLNPALPLQMPNFVRLCKSGTRFTSATTPSPLCAPARAALAAGVEYDRCGVPDNRHDYPTNQPAFYSRLRESGYHVMGCGKFDLAKSAFGWKVDGSSRLHEWGFSEGIDSEGKWDAISSGTDTPAGPYMTFLERRGLRQLHIEDMRQRRSALPFGAWPSPLPADAYGDNWIAAQALRLILDAPDGKPWFLQVNFSGPHSPWDITREMAERHRDRDFPIPTDVPASQADDHRSVRRYYAAMVENIDLWTGVMLDILELRGQLANTLVVVSSDHGDMLGERGTWGKDLPFQGSIGVPLVVTGTGVLAGAVISTPTTIMDLAATFTDFAGADPMHGWDSRSLREQMASPGARPPRDHVFSGLPQWRSVFDGRFKLVEFQDRVELRDLETDPGEASDLAASHPNIVRRLRALLQERGPAPWLAHDE